MAKIVPEPKDANAGYVVGISPEEAEAASLRIAAETSSDIKEKPVTWMLPSQQNMPLLFFRQIFTELRSQSKGPQPANQSVDFEEHEDDVSIEAFQRAFERLFYILQDKEPFDATIFDENCNGFVGWLEFSHVFNKRNISIKLSLPERIFLTLDNPECSHLASLTGAGILLTIVVSSLCFILSTAPEFQKDAIYPDKPEPEDIFDVIETICLIIFFVEYILRFLTCWAVRAEVHDKERLLALTTGYEIIDLSTPGWRLINFAFSPANVIDLVAIMPGILGWFGMKMEGGGFVCLRLVRLIRIFRAFKSPESRQPVVVIAQTISNSTKALYVLAFNLLLGILISGSLMYQFEKGIWEPETRTYLRVDASRTWNATTMAYEYGTAVSPFLSIPHAFWWAVTTATTVGYGDMFPTTTGGWVIGASTMMYSLVILALPVGVIGGNFTQVWAEYELAKEKAAEVLENDKKSITSAIQRIDPFKMSKLMLVEIWHERFPSDGGDIPPREGVTARPDVAEFMGEVIVELDLSWEHKVNQPVTLKLLPNPENKRSVTGTITVGYEWTPMAGAAAGSADQQNLAVQHQQNLEAYRENPQRFPPLRGTLKVDLISADGLLNLRAVKGKHYSNPYCLIYLYPVSPDFGGSLCPVCWRSPSALSTLNPRWNANHSFNFRWMRAKSGIISQPINMDAEGRLREASWPNPNDASPASISSASVAAPDPEDVDVQKPALEDEVIAVLHGLSRDVKYLRDEVGVLNTRIDNYDSEPIRNPQEDIATKIFPEPESGPVPRISTGSRPTSASGIRRPQSAGGMAAATAASMRMGGSPWMQKPNSEAMQSLDRPPSRPDLDRTEGLVLPHSVDEGGAGT